ncbi:hypothetical protein ACHHYP_00126 [Achlya hypogyna]|uniref:Calmodulin-lysine N-methyltransferase n=1 Tax=Achlya hypogyna TaxID=1202772 RepID=A0A1V9ZBD0_ACHHY|nr:hypothetical protein ACHHYP_00126 [Achlya hypogyna]
MTTPPTTTSKARWALLRRAICKASEGPVEASNMSIFQFRDPVLPQPAIFPDAAPVSGYNWVEHAVAPGRSIVLHQRVERAQLSLQELAVQAVDNTGNIRTWPSEDIVLRYLLRTLPSASFRVLELGAGMCGVAGFGLAAACPGVRHVTISDGNATCVENLARTYITNAQLGRFQVDTTVDTIELQWSRNVAPPTIPFDVVFASDCLFFEAFHDDLLHTLRMYLAPTGTCVLVQPSRGGSLERFVSKAQDSFVVEIERAGFDAIVDATAATADTRFDADIHLPVLVTLRHRSKVTAT